MHLAAIDLGRGAGFLCVPDLAVFVGLGVLRGHLADFLQGNIHDQQGRPFGASALVVVTLNCIVDIGHFRRHYAVKVRRLCGLVEMVNEYDKDNEKIGMIQKGDIAEYRTDAINNGLDCRYLAYRNDTIDKHMKEIRQQLQIGRASCRERVCLYV